MNAIIRAQILVSESETRDNFHQTVERIIEVTRPHRYAVPLAVSGDAILKAITPSERERTSRVSIWAVVSADEALEVVEPTIVYGGAQNVRWRSDCPTCVSQGSADAFAPDHDAARACESGKQPHCTCSRCF